MLWRSGLVYAVPCVAGVVPRAVRAVACMQVSDIVGAPALPGFLQALEA